MVPQYFHAHESVNNKLSFQVEEKARADARREARMNVKRANMANLEERKARDMHSYDNRHQQNIILNAARFDRAEMLQQP